MSGKIQILYHVDMDRLRCIENYINENLSGELRTDKIAAQFGIGIRTLQRHFFSQYRKSLRAFILKTRMDRAKEMLLQKEKTISEIAVSVGYNSVSGFTHAFTRYYGHSPSLLVRQLQQLS